MLVRIYNLAVPPRQAARGLSELAKFKARLAAGGLTAAGAGLLNVPQTVRTIIADVARRRDRALVDWELRLDQARLSPAALRVPAQRIAAARAAAEPEFLALVRRVAGNIRQYQESILHRDPPELVRGGRRLGVRYLPLERVGLYIPGGRALYPSSVLMTLVPAQVAGVPQIAIASPPRAGDDIDPLVLALAGELGVSEVYRLGGAVAVAALALGTPAVPRVDKIVGPGNAFVAEAKRQLFGRVGIDSIAGPSEVLIIADDTARPDWLAADMLAQAEHDPGVAVLVTPSARLAQAVARELARQLPMLERRQALRAALGRNVRILVTGGLQKAVEQANTFAAEHLQIITADDEAVLAGIRHAGAIFVGGHTPVPVGDYYAGPSHVLPTGGTARFFSPLSCNDFLKSSSVIRYDAASLAADAADIATFARREGLTAHARAVEIRQETP